MKSDRSFYTAKASAANLNFITSNCSVFPVRHHTPFAARISTHAVMFFPRRLVTTQLFSLRMPRPCVAELHGGRYNTCQFPRCRELVSLVSTQIFETVLRGFAARCTEVALPFRKLCFFPGATPRLFGALKIARKSALYLILKRWGHSPEEKERRSRKGRATSAHRAAKPREKHNSKSV